MKRALGIVFFWKGLPEGERRVSGVGFAIKSSLVTQLSEFGEIVRTTPVEDKIIIMGDFNARVGSDYKNWPALGRHGIGKCNRNGLALLTFCTENNLAISSTYFPQKNKYKSTWMHPQSKHWHLLDYVLVRQRDVKDVHSVRTSSFVPNFVW